jgi:hypothetical protein
MRRAAYWALGELRKPVRIKLQFVTLSLGNADLNIGVSPADKSLQWSFSEVEAEAQSLGSMSLSGLIDPPSIDQLAYDLYKVLAELKDAPSNVAEFTMKVTALEVPISQFDEYSRVRVVLDWIVKSYR